MEHCVNLDLLEPKTNINLFHGGTGFKVETALFTQFEVHCWCVLSTLNHLSRTRRLAGLIEVNLKEMKQQQQAAVPFISGALWI